jgi:hypothetical protein
MNWCHILTDRPSAPILPLATHEIGHWLNLRHIWGEEGMGCNGSDFVDDTPNQEGPNTGAPTFPHVTCNNVPNGDMFMNYMDYTDDAAMYMFTAGQVARMQAALENDRPGIGTVTVVQGWHHTDLTNAAGAPAAAGDPAGYIDGQGTQHVVYRGTDNHIHELRWDSSQRWRQTDFTNTIGAPDAAGPAGRGFDAQGTRQVVYRDTDNHSRELKYCSNRPGEGANDPYPRQRPI